jgi:signal transduction histidine kinase
VASTPIQALRARFTSLHARLSLISVLLFALIVGFGLFTIHLFSGFNEVSQDLRGRWLPSTRLLGDLNNFTSDYRTAEGDYLLANRPADQKAAAADMASLAQAVARAQRNYEVITTRTPDRPLYNAFAARWHAYLQVAARETALAAAGEPAQALAIYHTSSRAAYTAASDVLGALTASTVEQARRASARTQAAYSEALVLIVLALLLAGTLLAGTLVYIRRRVSAPLIDLAGTMRLLAANTTDIAVDGAGRQDEIGEMARAVMVFRANAIALMQSQHALSRQAAVLEEKLAYEQNLTRQQRNFVAMISHEFRTPLTVIDAHAQRLINMKDHIVADGLAERASRIRSAVQRITHLMENLLTSTRLVDGAATLSIHPAELDLAVVLREVCALHREIAPNAVISEDFQNLPLAIVGDAKLLFQAFSNLLSNAIKYSSEAVQVHIAARQDRATTNVVIRDEGLGIPREDIENLFDRYYRGGNVSGITGTGVGLYLAKTVVQLHGGEIGVESTEGVGSVFTVTLPNGMEKRLLF